MKLRGAQQDREAGSALGGVPDGGSVSVRAVKILAAVVVVAGCATALTLRFAFAGEAGRITRPAQPGLFYEGVGEIDVGASGVFAVAHNAGDTPRAASKAIAYGAQVIEIDVVSSRGQLRVSHDRPLPAFGALRLQTTGIEPIWRIAKRTDAVELDLKQSSPLFLEALLDFLRSHRETDVIVATRHAASLRTLRDRAPWVGRFLSIGNSLGLNRLKLDPRLEGVVEGVSIRQKLLDAQTVRWLKEKNLVVLAWVVDDGQRARELAGYGVDGIATDNLAIIELLAQRKHPNALSILSGGGGTP